MIDFLFYILAGAGVGLAIGLTGIGGGSLMTPLLLLFGIPPQVAIGTDLLYAAATKSGAVYSHHKQGTVRWKVAFTLGAGSFPAAIITAFVMYFFLGEPEGYQHILTKTLGFMLVISAILLLFKSQVVSFATGSRKDNDEYGFLRRHAYPITFFTGILLGVLVTLSSVGAGVFGTAVLMIIFYRLPTINLIGTELAHAVPLTAIAGIGHLFLGHVDFVLLAALLIGSIPMTQLGTKLSSRVPDNYLRPILAIVLLLLGLKYAVPNLLSSFIH